MVRWRGSTKRLDVFFSLTVVENTIDGALPWTKYAQKFLVHPSTGLAPFHCVLGYQLPLFSWSSELYEVPAVDDWIKRNERCVGQHSTQVATSC